MTLVPVRRIDADVAIVGSGFAGSILALVLRQQGRRVVLIDRARHPRFAIGESSTPLAGLLLEELADTYDLPRLRPFSKWGTWRATYPGVACGLKRGFSFFQHHVQQRFDADHWHERQLLVAASPHDGIADTHWYRPDFDYWLVREAESAGAVLQDGVDLGVPAFHGDRVVIEGVREGARLRVDAGFLVDASGPRGYLWRALQLGDAPLEWLPPTQALYTHFEDVRRWDALVPSDGVPPYPVDDAALHHVLVRHRDDVGAGQVRRDARDVLTRNDGRGGSPTCPPEPWRRRSGPSRAPQRGASTVAKAMNAHRDPTAWIWVLRFSNGLTSAGVAATDTFADAYDFGRGGEAWDALLADYPSVCEQFAGAKPTRPFVHSSRIAHRTAVVAGPRWALLPSAAGVVDPLLSTGFPLTLLGLGRLTAILARARPGGPTEAALAGYATDTVDELRATERLVAALYATMSDFALFKRLTTLYFAAASFAETVRRLGQPERARGFLLHADPLFGPALRELADRALARPGTSDRNRLVDDIDRAIEPFDVAGLGDRSRRDWYPVLASDLYAAQGRLGVSPNAIDALLTRCGFSPGDGSRANDASAVTGARA